MNSHEIPTAFLFHSAAREKVLHGTEILAGALRVTLEPKSIRERSERIGATIGDGITTATLLAHALPAEGIRNSDAGASAIDLKKGIDRSLRARRNRRNSPWVLTEEHRAA